MRWVIVVCFVLVGCSDGYQRAGPPTRSPSRVAHHAPQVAPAQIMSDDPVAIVNDFRRRNGLGSVVMDAKLVALANEQSSAMAESGRFDHTSSRGTFMVRMERAQNTARTVENIAHGYPDFPRVFNQWIISPQHKDNLLMRGATRIGYAKATASDGRVYHTLLLSSGGYE